MLVVRQIIIPQLPRVEGAVDLILGRGWEWTQGTNQTHAPFARQQRLIQRASLGHKAVASLNTKIATMSILHTSADKCYFSVIVMVAQIKYHYKFDYG